MDANLLEGQTNSAGNGIFFSCLVASFLIVSRTWNTQTKATFQSQQILPKPSQKCSSSSIIINHQSALKTRDTASPCYALGGAFFVREVHGSPLDLAQIERLRHQLGLVQRNEAFLLHAGDCAESFEACTGVSFSPLLPHFRGPPSSGEG